MPLSHHRKGWTAARSKPKTASWQRTKLRQTLRQRAQMMHDMLRSIGPNPVYNGEPRGSMLERTWTRAAKDWLDANQKRYVVA